jgi:hypothetical protein
LLTAFDDLIAAGASRYREQLQAVDPPDFSPAFGTARTALIESLDRALEKRTSLLPQDVSYSAGLCLPLIETGEWRYLDDQWAAGFGSAEPRVVAMGTEAANDPVKDLPWASGRPILALSGGSWAIGARLARGLPDEPWPHISQVTTGLPPFTERPDLFWNKFGWRLHPRHTWALVAAAVGGDRRDLDALFASTYLVERSVYVSRRSVGGLPPTLERVFFLKRLVAALTESATVLLLYGHAEGEAWEENAAHASPWDWANREITKAFLRVDRLVKPKIHNVEDGSARVPRVAVFDGLDRRVIWSRALSGSTVTNRYVLFVRSLIGEGSSARGSEPPRAS